LQGVHDSSISRSTEVTVGIYTKFTVLLL